MHILIVNGPNLNLLGQREPDVYGHTTLEDLLTDLQAAFPGVDLDHFQSNHEGAIIDRLQRVLESPRDGLVINAGALTHYSYALYDVLKALKLPKIEVHVSHIFAREAFRHRSVISPACDGMISGLGLEGYSLAIEWLLRRQTPPKRMA
jgi:3-dehydroquinate dehydratase II